MVISLLVLIVILSLGMLSLSVVAMRSSAASSDQATARANARLALLLAIGELQRSAGPDQRVTARADILDESIANPRLTGVWDSWEIKATEPPTEADYDSATKNDRFQGWLVSGTDPDRTREIDFASQAPKDPVLLLGEESLAGHGTAKDHVSAGKLPLSSPPGACAWAVFDEGIKARVNTPQIDTATSPGARTAQLGSGERPALELLPGMTGLDSSHFTPDSTGFTTISKGVSRANLGVAVEELAPGTREALAALTHDVTPHSLGLFTDTARGGLRQDFHQLSNLESLPGEYASRGIYSSLLGLSPRNAPSDPPWMTVHEFSRLHLDGVENASGVPLLAADAPQNWSPVITRRTRRGEEETVDPAPPPGVVLMPTIAKVQMIFSLIGRDLYRQPYYPPGPAPFPLDESKYANMHNPQAGYFRRTRYEYDLHLLYTPVVTLHNPYNVALSFKALNISFHNVPFAMQVFRNGRPQSHGLVPFETMFADNDTEGKKKVFGLNLKTGRRGRPGSNIFRLLPGETKLFSPYIDPNLTYADNFSGGRKFWDIYVSNETSFSTSNFDAIPGWRGDGIGWGCDWLAGNQRIDQDKNQGRWASCFGLAGDDNIHVEFAPISADWSGNKFTIKMSAVTPDSSDVQVVNAIEIDYGTRIGLQSSILGRGKTLRFPSEGTVRGANLVDHSTRKIKDIVNATPFAMLSVQAKTTHGGVDESDLDGRIATKPWAFAHATIGTSTQKIPSEHPAQHSHEIDIQMLDLGQGTTQAIGIDARQRGNFVTGHSADKGMKFGAMYDIPLAPVQTLAGLNGANPGGLSGHLPRFAQPIGNSWAHPALPADSISQAGSNGMLLDHSFLLNLALYDRFYFSGLADQTGAFGSGLSASRLAKDFAAGKPLDDPRLVLHRPESRAASELVDMVGDKDAYTRLAAWQLMRGAFNINSTSVQAWKAMLASVQDPQAIVNLVNPEAGNSRLTALKPTSEDEARISRLRLPLSNSLDTGGDARLAYWLGPREYDEGELERLAEEIVGSVRRRGPFLSLAEFVNRRLGNDDTAQRGALQEAIDNADLNRGLGERSGAGFEIGSDQVAGYKYLNPEAGIGPSYQGAPGFLSQADILKVLGNAATARSDTFTIRAYGEARTANGRVLASATCEAVVQRLPDWIDPQDPVDAAPDSLTSEANKTFGRRFRIASFRWLSSGKI